MYIIFDCLGWGNSLLGSGGWRKIVSYRDIGRKYVLKKENYSKGILMCLVICKGED